MSKKLHSTFWVVTTHVLTAGLAIPALAALVAAGVIQFGNLGEASSILVVVAVCGIMGYVGGTYYSLSYLKQVAAHNCWTDCTTPSVITSAVFAILGFLVGVIELPPAQRNAFYFALQLSISVIQVGAFAMITSSGFRRMKEAAAESEATSCQQRSAPSRGFAGALVVRLRNACVGFGVGFFGGLAVAGYMDQQGWNPPAGWQSRLLIATVVGGIGAFLGLVSNSPQRV